MSHSALNTLFECWLYNLRLLYSLERVPETGRWRFMDISPKYEASVRFPAIQTLVLLKYV